MTDAAYEIRQIREDRPPVLFVALQTGAQANGGIASIGQVIANLRSFRPIVLTNIESPVTARWREQGITVHICPEQASRGLGSAPLAAIRTYGRYFRMVRSLLSGTGARIVHANDPLAFQLSLAAVRSVPSARIALNIRDTLNPDRAPPRRKYRMLFRAADRVLMLSRDMVARWNGFAPIETGKALHTYSIVDFARFAPTPIEPAARRRVLVSGVASPKKGQLAFLREVAPKLAAAGIFTVLSGDFDPQTNPYAAECRRAAEPLGQWAEFIGYSADMPDLLRSVGCVAVCSTYEGLMRTMIEAMAAARPVVSTDVASAREMLEMEGRTAGIVHPLSHPDRLAESIISLCNDPAMADRLGSNGAVIAREFFNAERVITAYEGCYAAMLTSLRASTA
jgi:glycosyltransferase involved in cell wall biosynthesis